MLYTLLLASIQPSTHSTYTASCKPRQGPWHSCWHMTLGRWWPQAPGYPFQAEQLFPKKKRDSRSYKLVQSTFKHFPVAYAVLGALILLYSVVQWALYDPHWRLWLLQSSTCLHVGLTIEFLQIFMLVCGRIHLYPPFHHPFSYLYPFSHVVVSETRSHLIQAGLKSNLLWSKVWPRILDPPTAASQRARIRLYAGFTTFSHSWIVLFSS